MQSKEIERLIETYKPGSLARNTYFHAEYVTLLRAYVGIPADREPARQRYLDESGHMAIPLELYIDGMIQRMTTLCPDAVETCNALREDLIRKLPYAAPEIVAQRLSELFSARLPQ